MADSRLNVDFQGVDAVYLTFKIDNSTVLYDITKAGGSAQVNLAVKLTTDDTIALTTDGSMVLGKLLSVESDLMATVQVEGGMVLPAGNGASLTIGKKVVGAVDAGSLGGYIREVATATAAELGLERGMIINNDTLTAVKVLF
jgi:hypothetical protein